MLASIHPLGERARGQRWGITVTAYVVATLAASSSTGALLGAAGDRLGLPGAALVVAALAAVGVALDVGVGGLRVPTIHRQVDEGMLSRYRGWVYGASYGLQLGLGVVTVVNSAAVYVALALALLSGSAAGGLAVGATFGAARAAVLLATAGVREPDQLRRLHRRLDAWEPRSRRLAVAIQAVVAAVALVAVTTA